MTATTGQGAPNRRRRSQGSAEQGDLFGDRGAVLSTCERYRYLLWRRWDAGAPPVVFVMLNPSTADASVDDPTIRRCVAFARRWGAGGIKVVNLYAWRATKPGDLPAGPEAVSEPPHYAIRNANDAAIAEAVADASRVIVAWGAHPLALIRRATVMSLLANRRVEALGLTQDGAPRHPLYVRGDVEPVPYGSSLGPSAAEPPLDKDGDA